MKKYLLSFLIGTQPRQFKVVEGVDMETALQTNKLKFPAARSFSIHSDQGEESIQKSWEKYL